MILIRGPRRKIQPTDDEVKENERKYLETISKLEAIEKEYNEIKNSLRCRYCGNPHYAGGYCAACRQRLASGMSLERGKKKKEPEQRPGNITRIYEKTFGPDSILLLCDLQEIVKHSVLDERSKDCLLLYFAQNMTYNEIGQKYEICKERVRQIITKAMRKLNLAWK